MFPNTRIFICPFRVPLFLTSFSSKETKSKASFWKGGDLQVQKVVNWSFHLVASARLLYLFLHTKLGGILSFPANLEHGKGGGLHLGGRAA